MFQVRLATPHDLPAILDLIDGAAEWLRTKDTDQWARPWPDKDERDLRVLRGLLACRTWLVEDYGIPVATVTYRPDSHSGLWTEREMSEPAGYMSRLVVSRKYAGTAIGATLTDWAGARARAEFGAEYLRIDVWTTNVRLHSYYEAHGFHFLRFHSDLSYPSSALFYKKTADIDPAVIGAFSEIRAIPAPGSPAGAAVRSGVAMADASDRRRTGQRSHAAPGRRHAGYCAAQPGC
jgi:ribosomal protein S18 acetylase RimI-like enzyme